MDMKSLNYFVHAAETLNFTKAAKECYISQTAISLSIAKMEEELGFMLFDLDFSDSEHPQPRFYRAVMRNGSIDVAAARKGVVG